MKIAKTVFALAALAGLLMSSATGAVADGGFDSKDCPAQSFPVPDKVTERPVVYVHGWTASAKDSAMADAKVGLGKALGPGYSVMLFDYGWASTEWAAEPRIRTCLAEYIQAAGKAFAAAGGDGKVLAIGHSMGGVGIRAAAGILQAQGDGGRLAGVVTLGTPHQGSPWGGSPEAGFLEELKRDFNDGSQPYVPPSGSSAQVCLGWPLPAQCDVVPYLPPSVPIATIGTQITIRRELFDLPFSLGAPVEIPLPGDTIVPAPSANGYAGSAAGKTPPGTLIDQQTIACPENSGYLAQILLGESENSHDPARSALALVFSLPSVMKDAFAMDALAAGKLTLSDAPLLYAGSKSKCFHGNLPNYGTVVSKAAEELKRMAAPFTAPVSVASASPAAAPLPAAAPPAQPPASPAGKHNDGALTLCSTYEAMSSSEKYAVIARIATEHQWKNQSPSYLKLGQYSADLYCETHSPDAQVGRIDTG